MSIFIIGLVVRFGRTRFAEKAEETDIHEDNPPSAIVTVVAVGGWAADRYTQSGALAATVGRGALLLADE